MTFPSPATAGQWELTPRDWVGTIPLTGVVLTKADGDAKGGVALSVREITGKPIRFIGVGETARDLRPFDAGTFIHAILPVD